MSLEFLLLPWTAVSIHSCILMLRRVQRKKCYFPLQSPRQHTQPLQAGSSWKKNHFGISSWEAHLLLCSLEGSRPAACHIDKILNGSLLISLFFLMLNKPHFLSFSLGLIFLSFFFYSLISLISLLRIPSKSYRCFQFADLKRKLIITLTKAGPVLSLTGQDFPQSSMTC